LLQIIIGSAVTSIGQFAFAGASGSISFAQNATLTAIGASAFRDYNGTSIILPNSVQTVGVSAFRNCSNLTAIIFPSNLTSLGEEAFRFSRNLTSVSFYSVSPPALGSNAFHDTHATLKLYVPPESITTYQAETNWSAHASKIEAIES